MKRLLTMAILILILVPTICFGANNAAYKVNDNYVAVRNDVFKKLTANEKMIEIYEEQIKKLENGVTDLETLNKQKTEAYEKKIQTLQLTVEAKDAIIKLKDDNIQQYKNMEILYNSNKSEIRRMKRLNVWEKLFIAGLATFSAIKAEDSGSTIAIGTLGLAGCCINW